MKLLLRIPRYRPTPWAPAIYSARYALALGFGYLVLCVAVYGWDSVRAYERTASHGEALVRLVPYWRAP